MNDTQKRLEEQVAAQIEGFEQAFEDAFAGVEDPEYGEVRDWIDVLNEDVLEVRTTRTEGVAGLYSVTLVVCTGGPHVEVDIEGGSPCYGRWVGYWLGCEPVRRSSHNPDVYERLFDSYAELADLVAA